MPKRKSSSQHDADEPPLRRSTRQKTTTTTATATTTAPPADAKPPKSASNGKKPTAPKPDSAKKTTTASNAKSKTKQQEPQTKSSKEAAKVKKQPSPPPPAAGAGAAVKKAKTKKPKAEGTSPDGPSRTGRQYWLMKAEPESRVENGVDVKFSIDDLASKTEPEPWDGIRNFVARNNLRAMKKGDLAFFYHSNCKEPGIVGTMEVVQEHSPDLSAHDPKTPYYDPKSPPADPKWSVVHVEFRSKFDVQIGLKELREMGGPGKPLENMQMLKQSRLSVSKVSESEWEYLIGVAEEKAKSA